MGHWGRGQLTQAHEAFVDALDSFRRSGNGRVTHSAIFVLGEIRRAQGRLSEAAERYEEAIAMDDGLSPHATSARVALAEVLLERGESDAAAGLLEGSTEPPSEARGHRWCLAMAELFEARGLPADTEAWLEEAARRYQEERMAEPRTIDARRARWLIRQERWAEVERWARASGIRLNDPPAGFIGSHAQITYAEACVARWEVTDAPQTELLDFLDGLASEASSGGRVGSLIQVLLLRARACLLLSQGSEARQALAEALALGAPEGFLRTFLRHLPRLRSLVQELAVRGPEELIAQNILVSAPPTVPGPDDGGPRTDMSPHVVTPRESEILGLVEQGLRNQEIAKRLFISLSTVKRHTANIYAKLGVGSRTAAVARARELGIL